MEAKIQINYSEIDLAARRYVEYVGQKGLVKDYERILIQAEDADQLAEIHEEMMSSLMVLLMTWSISETDITGGKEVRLYLPDNARSSTEETVQREVNAYCVSYIEGKWFQLVGNTLAEAKAAESTIHLQNIRSAMSRRRPPIRRTPRTRSTVVGWVEPNDVAPQVTVTKDDEDTSETNGSSGEDLDAQQTEVTITTGGERDEESGTGI